MSSPLEFGVGTLKTSLQMAAARYQPLDFVMFQNFKHQIACITMQ